MAKRPNMRHGLQFVSPDNKVLNEVAASISVEAIMDQETQSLVDGMLHIANGTQGDVKRRTMVGLAAQQVGAAKRVIVVDVASTGMGEAPDLRVYINPVITEQSEQTESGREGCFSTGNVCGIVERSSEITVEAYDRGGDTVLEWWRGFTARIFQHEVDHLNGIRFPDRITDDTKLHWVGANQFGDYRTRWTEWDILCPRTRWDDIKMGNSDE